MKVYIVEELWDWQDSEILKIFSDKEKAEAYRKEYLTGSPYWYVVGIEEHEVQE